MNILIDMGNTRLKWALLQSGQLGRCHTLSNRQIDRSELIKAWKPVAEPQRLAIACVSSSALLELVLSVAVELWPAIEIIQVKSQAYAFGVTNAYLQAEKLGIDRWLALIAGWRHYPAPACIVDCGTAITVDLLDADGKHQGGLISPGLMLMRQSLAQGTQALTFNETSYPFGLASFTEAAIYSGALAAAVGLIEHVLSTLAKGSQLILTGGDAELVAEHLAVQPIIDSDLVLRGLAIVVESQ
jgi:type III pantothenate kinase